MSILSDYHYRFIKALLSAGAKFIIVGGHAVIYYGVRRATGDLDILVEPSLENGQKILAAFSKLGLTSEGLIAEDFEKEIFLGIGFEPDAVDIFTVTPGIEFPKSYQNTVKIQDRDIAYPMISIEDLITNKEQLNRQGDKSLIDQYDVSVLKKLHKKQE